MAEGVLGERGHGVSVEGEQREVRHAVEGRRRQHAQQVETQVKHLQNERNDDGRKVQRPPLGLTMDT